MSLTTGQLYFYIIFQGRECRVSIEYVIFSSFFAFKLIHWIFMFTLSNWQFETADSAMALR